MQTEIAIRIVCESKTCGNCKYMLQFPSIVGSDHYWGSDHYCALFEADLSKDGSANGQTAGHTTQRCQECLEAELTPEGEHAE